MGVNTGNINIDGYDINDLTLETLRNAISVIPQVRITIIIIVEIAWLITFQ